MAKFKKIIAFLAIYMATFFLFNSTSFAQTVSVDAAMSAAIGTQAVLEGESASKTHKLQDKIKDAQDLITLETNRLKAVHNKFYKGLTEVSKSIKNAYQVVEAAKIVTRIINYQSDMLTAAQPNELALAFALKSERRMLVQATKLLTTIEAIVIKSKDKNVLLNAGQRTMMLNDILIQLRIMEAISWRSYYTVKTVVSQGIINSLNPFKDYVNRDKQIVTDIVMSIKL